MMVRILILMVIGRGGRAGGCGGSAISARSFASAVRTPRISAEGSASTASHDEREEGVGRQQRNRAPGQRESAQIPQVAITPYGGLPTDAEKVLGAIPGDGSMIGNMRLRSMVELDNKDYAHAIQLLREADLIRVGRAVGEASGESWPTRRLRLSH